MSKIVEVASAEIGNKEVPDNSNLTKYGKWFGLDGVPWCGMFVSWVYAQSGSPLGNIGFKKGFAGCQTAVVRFKESGEITRNPVPGDIVFFDWNGDGRFEHTGIFIKKHNEQFFEAIEGNTSFVNNSNGGQVMSRKRSFGRAIFVHPKVLDRI